ncbi:AMP-binding protein [Alteromonadaceae bacterium BrNp21-10]|nr:AMP-binding protein [Alteromonadaceae bacterium BrNp21-10]
MQSYSLTIDKFLDHASKWFDKKEIVAVSNNTEVVNFNYQTLRERSNLLSGALLTLGLCKGDRIATLAWNTQHHLEMYYATMGIGLICHTLNPRFSANHLISILNEAGNIAIAVSSNLLPFLKEIISECPALRWVIVMDDTEAVLELGEDDVEIWQHDVLIEQCGSQVEWGGFDENTPAGLCYTSGTTGKPKGVLYSHRSNYLHTLRTLQADAIALTANDVLLIAVPMFHANAWGLPFSAPAVGAKMVLPGRYSDGESLAKLMLNQKVTVAAGVQTVWLSVMEYLDETNGHLPDLKRILIGGSKCPEALLLRIAKRLGVQVQTSWGMTELSPLGTISPPNATADFNATAGRPPMGVDLKLTDVNGVTLTEQRGVVGHLKVKGSSVIDRYYKSDINILDEDGYFDTGDLAILDEQGKLTICGRSKDLIKSGGEWINPVEVEEVASQHPYVGQVAVIGRKDDKWGERPVLIVEVIPGCELQELTLRAFLKGKMPDWWLPDAIIQVEKMPVAATGKIDKLRLSNKYKR